jgi:hypothetical protein
MPTANRALRNHDLGIEPVRSVIDGGGNVARHNGDPRQCTNIACSYHAAARSAYPGRN